MATRKRRELGNYIVADPEICHGQLTFKGTRILVKSVLFYVAEGKGWDWISQEYFGKVSREAIAGAVRLASEALIEKAGSKVARVHHGGVSFWPVGERGERDLTW